MLTRAFLEASLSFSTSLRGVSVGGRVFGISSTVVNPPAAAAAVPVAKSSLYASPMSRRCTWTSMRPGRAHNPDASIAPWLPASVLRAVFLMVHEFRSLCHSCLGLDCDYWFGHRIGHCHFGGQEILGRDPLNDVSLRDYSNCLSLLAGD